MATDPFIGLGNDAWAQLFGDTPSIDQLLATDTPTTSAAAQPQQTPLQLASQIPVWIWAVLGGSLLIVLLASKR